MPLMKAISLRPVMILYRLAQLRLDRVLEHRA